jgi:hypothetical protein
LSLLLIVDKEEENYRDQHANSYDCEALELDVHCLIVVNFALILNVYFGVGCFQAIRVGSIGNKTREVNKTLRFVIAPGRVRVGQLPQVDLV